ncbi:hypothetical protein BC829DRAFT_404609 [Chytridium lagenaria]|nr:hypothetical protein BC829DRAFT_404609 [Chytridium lagenaria]
MRDGFFDCVCGCIFFFLFLRELGNLPFSPFWMCFYSLSSAHFFSSFHSLLDSLVQKNKIE